MLLNNFKKLLTGAMSNTTAPNLPLILINGSTHPSSGYISLGVYSSVRSTFKYAGGNTATANTGTGSTTLAYNYYSLAFGGGTTNPDPADYQIETPYDTTDHFTWGAVSQTESIEGFSKTIVGTITNTSTDGGDLTISEVGVVAGGNDSNAFNPILIARSVITPVTLSYGATRTFQYTIDFSLLSDGVE